MEFRNSLDPAVMAQAREKQSAGEQLQVDKDSELQQMLEKCMAIQDDLSGRELELVMSCRTRMRSLRAISGAQEQGLKEIVAQHYNNKNP